MARFDKDKAFKNILGVVEPEPEKGTEPVPQPSIKQGSLGRPPALTGETLIQKSYYITEAQYKALKIRAATSEDPIEKDLSAIVRAALDMYLHI